MEISQFELIFKPQSPAAPAATGPVASVLQGYFLKITNLEDKAYKYGVEFIAAPVADSKRSLSGNTVVFVDTPGSNNVQGVLLGALDDKIYRPSIGLFEIPAHGTALVAVLPSAFGPVPGDPTPLTAPDFEARGYVRLRLPPVYEPCKDHVLKRVAQGNSPVRVLVTPQNRAVYFDATGAITDQTQATLTVSSGKAENALKPEPGGPIVVIPGKKEAVDISAILRDVQGSETQLIASLLAQINTEKSDLAAFNKLLKACDVPLAIEKRNN